MLEMLVGALIAIVGVIIGAAFSSPRASSKSEDPELRDASMQKIYGAMHLHGIPDNIAIDIVNEMQSSGVQFKES